MSALLQCLLADEGIGADITPVMSALNTPPYIVSAQSTLGGFPAWQAFDGNVSTRFVTQTAAPCWFQLFKSGAAYRVAAYTINNNSQGNLPKAWTFEYSLDGSIWVVADTQTLSAADPLTGTLYKLATPALGSYFRWNISAYNNASQLDFRELRLWAP